MNWADDLREAIKEGRQIISTNDLNRIAQYRYELATWRAYVGNKWAEFDQQYSQLVLAFLMSENKISVAQATIQADCEEVAKYRHEAKEMLNTIDQLLNACSTMISCLLTEIKTGNLDTIK